ncbi:MAG: MBL fold metallo-hydrolase [Gammaproteobacteria bacterium]|jgi:glyoxylase-like metal-dependent hydrolase (beta-lactamase superfamily II)|nr:MBL fold metallo-hydrolase [Gammaproteobacteria bacterium]
MKKLILLSAILLLGEVLAADYPPVTVDVSIEQVSEHAYYAPGAAGMATENEGFISNAGFVVTDAGVVVFDSLGSPSLAWALRQRIREITDKPVVKVVVSHYHADHIYGLQVFKDEGAQILAPRGAYEYLDSAVSAERLEERRLSLDPWVNDDTRLVRPDLMIEEFHPFSVGGIDFQLNYLGSAHSDGDLTMYVVQDRVLFSGDIIFESRVPFVGDADTKRWLETLETLETDELVALVPGHGPAASDPVGAVSRTREYIAYLRGVMGAAVENLDDFAKAYDAADWSRFENLPAFDAANRRNAYQVFLSMEAEALGQ